MIYIGVDPGRSGGIAFVDSEIGEFSTYPMPETRLEIVRLMELISDECECIAIVESVHAMPKQGVTSMFSFGKGYGELLGICTALGFKIHQPTPQAWKKEMLAGTDKSKQAAIQMAENLFPEVKLVPKGCRKPSDGMAEALLLAEYGRRLKL